VKKDLKVYASAFPVGDTSNAPIEDHPLATRYEPSALEGWILEILYCDPKGSRAFLRILSTEGRGVYLSGNTTPCRMTGVTLHSHVHYKEI